MLEAKACFPTTSIAGGLFMLKRTKKIAINKYRDVNNFYMILN
ncbi:MAG: hypothetical protein E7B42_07525 [Peptoniphilus harei]|nr:hypothetical protein [Peptoniphilus harei]